MGDSLEVISGVKSTMRSQLAEIRKNVVSGEHQGSVLGPILFNFSFMILIVRVMQAAPVILYIVYTSSMIV